MRHPTTALCLRGTECKCQCTEEDEKQEGDAISFKAYSYPLEMVNSLRYLGKALTATKNDWPEVVGNLRRARQTWAQISRVLGREGVDAR